MDNDDNDLTIDSVQMQNIIGQGAFGLVHKAIITMGDREETVAVKMLRSNWFIHQCTRNSCFNI